MRTLNNIASASALALLAANTDAGGGNAQPEIKFYSVEAGTRNSKESGDTVTFVIAAESYKSAWELARKVTRTGSADFADEHEGALRTSKDDATVPKIKAGVLSVKKVDSLQERRSKKDALTVDRLLEVMAERNITVPKALQGLIDELNQSGPAAAAEPNAEQPAAQAS